MFAHLLHKTVVLFVWLPNGEQKSFFQWAWLLTKVVAGCHCLNLMHRVLRFINCAVGFFASTVIEFAFLGVLGFKTRINK